MFKGLKTDIPLCCALQKCTQERQLYTWTAMGCNELEYQCWAWKYVAFKIYYLFIFFFFFFWESNHKTDQTLHNFGNATLQFQIFQRERIVLPWISYPNLSSSECVQPLPIYQRILLMRPEKSPKEMISGNQVTIIFKLYIRILPEAVIDPFAAETHLQLCSVVAGQHMDPPWFGYICGSVQPPITGMFCTIGKCILSRATSLGAPMYGGVRTWVEGLQAQMNRATGWSLHYLPDNINFSRDVYLSLWLWLRLLLLTH